VPNKFKVCYIAYVDVAIVCDLMKHGASSPADTALITALYKGEAARLHIGGFPNRRTPTPHFAHQL
jgi:hypothetical protein